eukprot:m.49615 g.49615  ORF g.49615 m.49615 type:complete len:609 (+) comp6139_c0_seq2:858-2684(+)
MNVVFPTPGSPTSGTFHSERISAGGTRRLSIASNRNSLGMHPVEISCSKKACWRQLFFHLPSRCLLAGPKACDRALLLPILLGLRCVIRVIEEIYRVAPSPRMAEQPVPDIPGSKRAHVAEEEDPVEPSEPVPLPVQMPALSKLAGYEFYRTTLRSPKFVVAPMVEQSELAWRMLSRRYGAELCYTPMLNSTVYVRDSTYRKQHFSTCPEDRPLIAQICGHDPGLLVKTALMLQDHCDAIDLNLGCPQNIAKRGHYGAFLSDDWPLVSQLVRALHEHVSVPITCKIRMLDTVERTVQYAQMIRDSGCQMLTIHGRNLKQKGALTGIANWKVISAVKQALDIPVLANGNILYHEDVHHCMRETGVDGVMTAEGNLSNPALFAGEHLLPIWQMVEEYLELVEKYPCPPAFVKAHLFRLFHPSLTKHSDLRDKLAHALTVEDLAAIARDLNARLRADASSTTFTPTSLVAPSHVVGPRSDIPHWFCQPKLHDLQKDEMLSQRKTEAQPQPVPAPAADPPAKRVKVRAWDNCECGSPCGSKCEFKLCRQCCRTRIQSTRAPCPSHKLWPPREGQTRPASQPHFAGPGPASEGGPDATVTPMQADELPGATVS